MENKNLGIILIISCVLVGVLVYSFNGIIAANTEEACSCTEMDTPGGFCPHEGKVYWPTYLGMVLVSGIGALGLYLIFFEKSQKEIVSALSKDRQVKSEEERFSILLKGLSLEEKRVITAVKEQDGITQQTLRLRTDLHKSKLSLVLDSLEKKGLVKREQAGKTNKVFLKIAL